MPGRRCTQRRRQPAHVHVHYRPKRLVILLRRVQDHVLVLWRSLHLARRVTLPGQTHGELFRELVPRHIVNLIRSRIPFLVHYAEFGQDADKRDYEVDYSRIQRTGFKTTVDIDMGLNELVHGLRLMRLKNPYSNV